VAVNKVEELTRQLDELRNGKRKPLGNSNLANVVNEKNDSMAISELEKLKQELDVSWMCRFRI
jgi:benzoyl-CoA reductase/2-hydroxyglutaryl-CoA dehydratase subunit BcrC/BadD/HgdB